MIIGILVLVAIVGAWLLIRMGVSRGFDEVVDGTARIVGKKGNIDPDLRSSMILRDESEQSDEAG